MPQNVTEIAYPGLSPREILNVEKPAQYLGGEVNAVIKDDSQVDVRFALAFPDTYEVGMSHQGFHILYDILNRDPKTWAERAYMPMADMEIVLRRNQLPLLSLESKRPLRKFDLIGFSLQYELCGTNILSILELSGLKFYAHERSEYDPIIIGGGPYSYHPEALAPFFDVFLLGDAEEGILEVVSAVRRLKEKGQPKKSEILAELSKIEGIYLPAEFSPEYDQSGKLIRVNALNPERPQITRRLLPSMRGAPYPQKPVVPNIQIVHNRLSVEVMRGCVRGCRFCQAGYLYRPQRERPPEEILKIVETALPQAGYEEISLLSLSTADYCSIVPLLKKLMDKYAADDKVAISFPSTRVDALTPEVLEQVQRVRRTGFTIAPEGGSQRLRDVINKGVSDEQILETCGNIFRMGWKGVKLYFMLGLPTENDEDLRGIIAIADRVRRLPEARGKEITVSVSTHVPKPHTPFQWAEQISPQETIRRQRLLADGLRQVKVNFRYHNAFSSFLEGVFCRAGREITPAIVRAYELGSRLDAWQDRLREDVWMQAFLESNIDPYFYLREREIDEALPWDHLSCGISKDYFAKEYQRALRFRVTPDCLTTSCSICGACDYDVKKNVLWPRAETEKQLEIDPAAAQSSANNTQQMRMRFCYEKSGTYRYVGHLELVSVFYRAARRAELPLSFSQGFHPVPRLSFGPPLQLGIASLEEYMDAIFSETLSPESVMDHFNASLPQGIRLLSADEISMRAPSLQERICGQRFRVRFLVEAKEKFTEDQISDLNISREAKAEKTRQRKAKKARQFRLGDYICDFNFYVSEESVFPEFHFTLTFDPSRGTPKPQEVVKAVSGLDIGEYEIEKTQTFFRTEKTVVRAVSTSDTAGEIQQNL